MNTRMEKYAEIQAMVQKEARDIATQVYKQMGTQYGVSKVPLHYHNGIDSPQLIRPDVTYIGFVPYEPPYDNTATLQLVLPGGWTYERAATGQYTVTHNLGNASDINFYSVITQPVQSTNEKCVSVVSMFENTFDVFWFKISDGTAVNTSFTFQLVTGNNKTPFKTQYITRNFPS